MVLDVPLPIDEALPDLRAALAAHARAVLVAPPGAGKTTRAPLALIEEPWAAGKRLLLLEPRRLAARAAAARMAASLGEAVGETIGLIVRLQSLVSRATRIEVVTEGVFTRMILDDPSLEGVAAVLFDEFHERSLDADLGLALALDAQAALREDVRLLVMSATLDGARVRALLGDAPLIESEGRAYPVLTRYVGRNPRQRIEDEVARVTLEALADETGSMLVFLPGQGEIRRVAEILEARVGRSDVDVAPLYSALDSRAQDLAIRPAPPGRRKIVLATSIAETSLTIEGVRVVIDSGLMRVPRYEPDVGLTRLETVRVAKANANQRRGRAGRVEPGVCYRLWEEAATGGLKSYGEPEILSADLSRLALDCAVWGEAEPARLAFLDPPPRAALAEARTLLTSIGAIDAEGRITDEGRAIARLALPPRLARIAVDAARAGDARTACEIAVVLTERGLGGDAADLMSRLEAFRCDRSQRADDARRLARGLAQKAMETLTPSPLAGERGPKGRMRGGRAARLLTSNPSPVRGEGGIGALLASAYPERIAMARGKRGEFLMANGRAASLEPHEALSGEPFLAIGEVAGRAAAARILLAAPLSLNDIETVAGGSIETADDLSFDRASAALRARRRRRLGALVLSEQALAVPPDERSALALARGVLSLGVPRLPWSKALRQWRDRVMFVRRAEGEPWPDLSDARLSEDPDWLAPFLIGKTRLDEINSDDVSEALRAVLPWDLQRRLDEEAPTHFLAPTGTAAAVDYEAEGGPAIALRVQELFGLEEHPSVAGGRIPLTLHLLSPAHRLIQITRDLPIFWRGSWAAVRSDLRGRYPRHFWPEDPASAAATTRAKPRGT
ncbi:MAG TPA: ATP-dependent helicase HrpB [Roseiarcus sp.]|jgi:ATP-dependent helicase HrpB|nr:ATP-dependent helicase HrpB [Roseiarcus sp.]